MGSSKQGKRNSVTNFINTMVDRVFGNEAAPPVEKKMQNLAHKQAKIRAVSVRRGFQAIRARSDEMAQRLEEYKRQREGTSETSATSSDAPVTGETIVLASDEPETHQRRELVAV